MTISKGIRERATHSVGKTYNHMLVLSIASTRSPTLVLCRCRCGLNKIVPLSRVKNGDIKSCGCWKKESSTIRATKHGMRFIPEYQVWQHMIARCTNLKCKSYHRYGGRGIKVCEKWLKFENFIADMGRRPSPNHSIERNNNDGPYSPDNCKWATRLEQAANTRRVNLITYEGQTMSVRQWSIAKKINYGTLYYRLIEAKWPLELALGGESLLK